VLLGDAADTRRLGRCYRCHTDQLLTTSCGVVHPTIKPSSSTPKPLLQMYECECQGRTQLHIYHCITVYIRHHPASPTVFTLLFIMQAASMQPHQTARLATAPQPKQPLPRPPYAANKNTTALTRPKNPVVSTPWNLRLSTHPRLAHSQEAQLTSCFDP
jgi:hypothetical protein